MSTPTYRSSSNTNAQTASGTSLSVNKPVGGVQNDLFLVILTVFVTSDVSPSAPSGWTQIGSASHGGNGTGNDIFVYYWYKVAGASEPASYSFTWTGANPANISAEAWQNCDTTTPIDASSVNQGSGTSVTVNSVTPSVSGGIQHSLAANDFGTWGTEPSGWAHDWDDGGQSNAGDHRTATLTASTASGSATLSAPSNPSGGGWSTCSIALKPLANTINGSANILAEAGILGGLAGMGILSRGIAAGPTLGGGLAGMGILPSGINAGTALGGGLSGQGATGGGLAGQGEIQASSTALDSATLEGVGNLGGGMGGQGEVNASSAATPSISFQGIGSLLGGFGAGGILGGGVAAASALAQGLVGAAGFISGFGAQALINAAGNTGGAIHAAATILGLGNLGANLTSGAGTLASSLGGGQARLNPSSAATPSLTLGGNGTLGGNLIQGVAIILGSSVAAASSSFRGIGSFLGGFGGSAGFAGGFGGQALVSGLPGLLRLPPFSFAFNRLQQLVNYAFSQKQKVNFVYGATQALTFSFKQVPEVATPNSTITTTMTATDVNGNLIANLATCACTVTFPDGTTQAFSLVGGTLTNLGAGKYSITYNTKSIGEIVEDWSGTDQTGNKAEFHNITPVSF